MDFKIEGLSCRVVKFVFEFYIFTLETHLVKENMKVAGYLKCVSSRNVNFVPGSVFCFSHGSFGMRRGNVLNLPLIHSNI